MKINDVYNAINTLAPFSSAEEWDNCGLLLGSLNDECNKAFVCLDVTDEVITQAIENKAQLIISHHPVIFDPLKTIDYNGKIAKLIRNNIAVISAHTNLDIAENGVNDTLCKILNLTQPAKSSDFFLRICECERFENAILLAKFVKEKLNSNELTYIDANKPINRIAVCSGSGSSLVNEVINEKVDAFITGELKHNTMLELFEMGISVIMAGHFSTEVVITKPLTDRLNQMLPEINFLTATETPLVMEV